MLQKNILPPSSKWQWVSGGCPCVAVANTLKPSYTTSISGTLSSTTSLHHPHAPIHTPWSRKQCVPSKCQNKQSTLHSTNTQKMTTWNHDLHNCHENPKSYNKFTRTSEDVHSSKRPAMYRSFGPFHPPSSLQSHDRVARSSTQTCIMTVPSIWEEVDRNIKLQLLLLSAYLVWYTQLPSWSNVLFGRLKAAQPIKKLCRLLRK
jgi:hypothetical protein